MKVVVSSLGIVLLMLSFVPRHEAYETCHCSRFSVFNVCKYKGPTDPLFDDVGQLCSLMDKAKWKGTQTAYACENNDIVLECPADTEIKVMSANYGRTSQTKCDPRVLKINHDNMNTCIFNTAGKVITQCDGQTRCQFRAANSLFGDPCRGNYKFLEVNFSCEEKEAEETQTAYVCENNDIVLECPAGTEVKVMSANYGRTSHKCDPRVLGVNNNMNMCTLNVVGQIAAQCDGQKRCQFQLTIGRFGDPCYGIYKYLEVNFSCQ